MLSDKVSESHEFIENMINRFDDLGFITSFGKDSMVVHYLLRQHDIDIPIVWVQTPFLPEETYELADKVIDEWNADVHKYSSEKIDDEEFMKEVVMGGEDGEPLYERDPSTCCNLFKVRPAQRAVLELGIEAWFSGLRATESEKRSKYTKVWKQGEGNVVKLHPLLEWTEEELWEFTEENDIPYHPWYDREGVRSIGCAPCTDETLDGTERGGRWAQTAEHGQREKIDGCGLHCLVFPSDRGECEDCPDG